MKKNWKTQFLLTIAFAMTWAVFGCVGLPSPATAPAPLVEIPSAVQFPESIQVDTPELAPAGAGGGLSMKLTGLDYIKAEVLPIGGAFFDAITFGFTTNTAINLGVASVLKDLHSLSIPINPITRVFDVPGPTGGVFIGNGVRIDFADYDFDGNGTTVGCTGCTCPTGCDTECPSAAPFEDFKPVCFRIWADPFATGTLSKLMAGFFRQLPIEDDPATPEDEQNPGAGSYRVRIEFSFGGPPVQITSYGADYDHRNPDKPFDKVTQYYLSQVTPLDTPLNAVNNFVTLQQQALDGATDDSLLFKTVRESVNQESFTVPDFVSTFEYIARYRTDKDLWSGTFQDALLFPGNALVEPPPGVANFTDECAQLSTAFGLDEGACSDPTIGINVTHVPPLELLKASDQRFVLPVDFPSTPPPTPVP